MPDVAPRMRYGALPSCHRPPLSLQWSRPDHDIILTEPRACQGHFNAGRPLCLPWGHTACPSGSLPMGNCFSTRSQLLLPKRSLPSFLLFPFFGEKPFRHTVMPPAPHGPFPGGVPSLLLREAAPWGCHGVRALLGFPPEGLSTAACAPIHGFKASSPGVSTESPSCPVTFPGRSH